MCSTLFPCLMLPCPLSFCLNNPPKTTISKAKIALTQHALSVLALARRYLFLFIFLSRRRGERGDTGSTGPRRNSSSTAEARVCDVSDSKSDIIWCDCVKNLTGTDFVELFALFTMSSGSGSQAGREQRRARTGSRPEKSTLFIVSAGL